MAWRFNPFTRKLGQVSVSTAVNGSVFITDIEPTGAGNVGGKIFSSDGNVLDSCFADTDFITVYVRAQTGITNYKPEITVNGIAVPNMTQSPEAGEPQWDGSIDINLGGLGLATALHEDGASHTTTVTPDVGPAVLSAVFTGGYPGVQTELKQGDTYDLRVQTDSPMTRIEIYDFEACESQVFNFAASVDETVTVTIADRGNAAVLRPARIRCRNAVGSWGGDYDTDSAGLVDGVNVVNCNNLYPSLFIGAITYPGVQSALKDAETATIVNTASNYDTISYTSPTAELSITNPALHQDPKTVQRIAGGYNISVNNFRIAANRIANNASTTVQDVVNIAHDNATLQVTEPAARLVSGGNAGTVAQNHTITITADQSLLSSPTLGAPIGIWQGVGFVGGPAIWTRALQIHDNDAKGTYAWGAISGTNLAGRITNAITGDANYILGGFVERTLTIAAWTNREANIGTQVATTGNLVCENISKGGAGPNGGTMFLFQASIADAVDRFTITQPSGVYNATGNLWYNCDLNNALSNTTGTAEVILEETA